jgi:hypothetical protein
LNSKISSIRANVKLSERLLKRGSIFHVKKSDVEERIDPLSE